jgi:hypothetical protein
MKLKIFSVLSLMTAAALTAGSSDRRNYTSDYTIGSSIQPMVIYGEGWSQRFTIINVDYYNAGEPTIGTLRFYTRDGQPWRIPLKGIGTTDQVPVNLRSGQMMSVETEVSSQSQQLGWAYLVLSSNTDEWGLYHAFTTYRKQTPGAPDLMTSVPFVDDLEDEWIIPFDNTGAKYPGIGLLNAGSTEDSFMLEVYDTAGTLRKVIKKTVAPRNFHWFSLLAEHPDLTDLVGQIKVHGSGSRSAAFTLQFAPSGAFTALPIVHTYGMR